MEQIPAADRHAICLRSIALYGFCGVALQHLRGKTPPCRTLALHQARCDGSMAIRFCWPGKAASRRNR